jgi:hypothetical protein
MVVGRTRGKKVAHRAAHNNQHRTMHDYMTDVLPIELLERVLSMVDFDTLGGAVPMVCWRMRHAVKTTASLWRQFYRHHYGGETRDAAVVRMMSNNLRNVEVGSVHWWRAACADAHIATMQIREQIASGQMGTHKAFAIACSMSWLAIARRMSKSSQRRTSTSR